MKKIYPQISADFRRFTSLVIPESAQHLSGIQNFPFHWIPAFAGMTTI